MTDISIVILCGGYGSRLYPLTKIIPKGLLPIVNKAAILHQIEFIRENFKNAYIFFLTFDEYAKRFEELIKLHSVENVEIISHEARIGMVRGLKKFKNKLNEILLLIYSDVFPQPNFESIINCYRKNECFSVLALCCLVDDCRCYGRVRLTKKNKVVEMSKERYPGTLSSKYVSCGTFLTNKKMLDYSPEYGCPTFSDLWPRVISKNDVYAIYSPDIFVDYGRLSDYLKLQKLVLRCKPEIGEFRIHVNTSISRSSALDELTVVGENVTIGHNCKIQESLILRDAIIGDNCIISNSIIAPDSNIKNDSQLSNCCFSNNEIIYIN